MTYFEFLYGLKPLEATGASTAGAMRLGIGVVLATALAYLRADNGASSVNFRDGSAVIRAGAARDDDGECHQCYDSCNSKQEAFDLCTTAYYQTCAQNKQILTFCSCEQDGSSSKLVSDLFH